MELGGNDTAVIHDVSVGKEGKKIIGASYWCPPSSRLFVGIIGSIAHDDGDVYIMGLSAVLCQQL